MIKVKVSLFNSTTDDTAVVIDQLRASTTITVALNYFKCVIPVDTTDEAFKLKKEDPENIILAGEHNLQQIEGFDMTNSPYQVKNYDNTKTLVLKTTNGTHVLGNIKKRDKNIKVLIGSAINAKTVAHEALKLATDEIELIMAGRHETFNIEDALGAGIITEEIIKVAKEKDVKLEIEESALACLILAEDHEKFKNLMYDSWGGKRLKSKGADKDVEMCTMIDRCNNVGIYHNDKITNIKKSD